MPPLFSFGTLMDEQVLACVSGQPLAELRVDTARLPGYAQREVVAQAFPVLIADVEASTSGILIYGLTDLALERILFFEGDEYHLDDIVVERRDGETVPARYFQDAAVYDVKNTSWDFEVWRRRDKADFVLRTRRFMELFGSMSATEADAYW